MRFEEEGDKSGFSNEIIQELKKNKKKMGGIMEVPCFPSRHGSVFGSQVLREKAMNNFHVLLNNNIDIYIDIDIDIRRVSSYSLLLFILLIIFFPEEGSCLATDESQALLQLKKSFTNDEALDSWKPNTDACDINNRWKGVVCNHERRVANLNLGDANLSGTIDMDALVQITGLRGLSVMYNKFSGPIPKFNRLRDLKSLYLVGNEFWGEIPSDYFKKMLSLKKIWLSENKFTGQIPYSLTQLSLLTELHLENNQFTGKIPELKQPRLSSFNVSNNNLTGEVPEHFGSFNASAFLGNPGLCGEKVGKPCSVFLEDHSANKDTFNSYFVMLLIISVVVLALMSLGIYVLYSRQQKDSNAQKMSRTGSGGPNRLTSLRDLTPSKKGYGGSSRRGSSRRGKDSAQDLVMVSNNRKYEFSLTDLMSAAAEVLANGTMGSAYKATMSDALTVFVKRVKGMDKLGREAFENHMTRLGRLKHDNIITTLAFHYQRDEKLLVNEYIPGGSLLYVLHGDRGASHDGLNLATRVKIIKGIAQGLGYLHSELASDPHDVPHGDLKSSNVLLDSNYDPILTDFGYSFLMQKNQCKQSLFAYRSPEAATKKGVSPKTDVYCLGVVILELFTGKIPSLYVSNGAGGIDIVTWVKSLIAEGKEAELIDPDIATDAKNNISPRDDNVAEKLILIGAACTETDPQQRLDIREVINRIESIHVDPAVNQELDSDNTTNPPSSSEPNST